MWSPPRPAHMMDASFSVSFFLSAPRTLCFIHPFGGLGFLCSRNVQPALLAW
jgi:hypothetical protein